jgi:uncharacterized membrane protein YcaP (DUF421 family)
VCATRLWAKLARGEFRAKVSRSWRGSYSGITLQGFAMTPHWWLPEVSVGEKILRALIVYFFLLVMFRLLGKREVGQLTLFDLIVLLILSNVLQNAMIGPDNSVSGGLIGAATILGANWVVSRFVFDSRRFERLVEGVPTVLIHHGKFVEANMRREIMTKDDLLSSLRTQGIFNIQEVETAVLETSGKISVMKDANPRELGMQR